MIAALFLAATLQASPEVVDGHPLEVRCDYSRFAPPEHRCYAAIGGVLEVGHTPEEAAAKVRARRALWIKNGCMRADGVGGIEISPRCDK